MQSPVREKRGARFHSNARLNPRTRLWSWAAISAVLLVAHRDSLLTRS